MLPVSVILSIYTYLSMSIYKTRWKRISFPCLIADMQCCFVRGISREEFLLQPRFKNLNQDLQPSDVVRIQPPRRKGKKETLDESRSGRESECLIQLGTNRRRMTIPTQRITLTSYKEAEHTSIWQPPEKSPPTKQSSPVSSSLTFRLLKPPFWGHHNLLQD